MGKLARLSSWQPLIVGEAGDGEEEGIWQGLPWAEGGAFFTVTVHVQYDISFRCTVWWLDIYITYQVIPQ